MLWFKKCNFWKNSLSLFRGCWGQEVIFEIAEAKFWISSSFHRFSFKNFHRFGFQACLTSATLATSEGRVGRISNYVDSRPLGWFKNTHSSQTEKLMAAINFSDYLGLKHYKKAKKLKHFIHLPLAYWPQSFVTYRSIQPTGTLCLRGQAV